MGGCEQKHYIRPKGLPGNMVLQVAFSLAILYYSQPKYRQFCGVFFAAPVLKPLDLPPASLRVFALVQRKIHSQLLSTFRLRIVLIPLGDRRCRGSGSVLDAMTIAAVIMLDSRQCHAHVVKCFHHHSGSSSCQSIIQRRFPVR